MLLTDFNTAKELIRRATALTCSIARLEGSPCRGISLLMQGSMTDNSINVWTDIKDPKDYLLEVHARILGDMIEERANLEIEFKEL